MRAPWRGFAIGILATGTLLAGALPLLSSSDWPLREYLERWALMMGGPLFLTAFGGLFAWPMLVVPGWLGALLCLTYLRYPPHRRGLLCAGLLLWAYSGFGTAFLLASG